MDIRRRFLSKKSSGGSSGGDSSGTYTVNLNSQWEKTTAITNPDSSLYDGVYRSTSNYNVHNTAAIMYIDISGLTSFKLYIRSYAESSFDYVMVSQLDQTINNSTSYSNTSLVKAHTRGNQQSGTALSSYTLVEFTGIDGGSHRITIVYRKDGSANSGDDRGYVLIPKSQGSGGEGGGDVDIDTTYSIMYTSSDGNVVNSYGMTSALRTFGANITSNTYVNGQGIITFDAPVTSIGSSAFSDCSSLKSITIPDSVTAIGSYAFSGCTSLTSATIPDSVTSIGGNAFNNCQNLTSVIIPDSVTEIVGWAFAGCTSLTSVTIPDSVASIGNSAFYGCTSLTSVNIPNGITSIETNTFYNCYSLISITIPNSVISIGSYAFGGCKALTSVTIPASVTSINSGAFDTCSSLTHIYCKPTTPPTLIGSNIFASHASGRKFYVPTASVSAYKTADVWSNNSSHIIGYDFEDDGESSIILTPNATTDDNRRAYELINSQAVFDGVMSYDWVPTTTNLLISGEVGSTTLYQELVRSAVRNYDTCYHINFESLYDFGFVTPIACLYPDGYFSVYDDDD